MENNIENIRARHMRVNQGYVKCSIIPVDDRRIITSDKGIKTAWEKAGGIALFVRPGNIKLPGYKTGFIGGTAGVTDKQVLFAGNLRMHPDAKAIRNFIKKSGKGIVELYNGPLYDVGTILLSKA
ncbi:MAG TPA: hypothetical protein ENN16_01115 [Candidatus Omnitrophica bacterium]|nr:hypothetical protein [Candidatus Omnitrophota bacterium]